MEAMVQLEGFDLIANMETWWDESRNWNTKVEDYKLFWRHRQDRRHMGVAFYVCKCIFSEELPLKKHPWHLVVGVYYRLIQGSLWTFLLQLQEASCFQVLIIMGDFNYLDVNWKTKQVANNPGVWSRYSKNQPGVKDYWTQEHKVFPSIRTQAEEEENWNG